MPDEIVRMIALGSYHLAAKPLTARSGELATASSSIGEHGAGSREGKAKSKARRNKRKLLSRKTDSGKLKT
jgi:hypothetical protein